MELSVAYTFDPGLIEKLAAFPQVSEIYGKLHSDIFGGGRWSATLRRNNPASLEKAVRQAHRHGVKFNYLLNCADLYGLEQSRAGQKKIRSFLDFLSRTNVDSLTVAVPYLLKLVKAKYPHFKVRVGVFARIADEVSARRWEDLGADTITLSSILCNRNFPQLRKIRQSVRYANLQLIANASCLNSCIHEFTHMHMLSRGSRKGDSSRGFLLDYCFLNCSAGKIARPHEFMQAGWIRPEDLEIYEDLGYHHFKIVERSCPTDLLVKRVQAYAQRKFEGNLLEIVGPVAHITGAQNAPLEVRIRLALSMLRPGLVNLTAIRQMHSYVKKVLISDFSRPKSPVYIDNRALDGFLRKAIKAGCNPTKCTECSFCKKKASEVIQIRGDYKQQVLSLAYKLEQGMISGSHWF